MTKPRRSATSSELDVAAGIAVLGYSAALNRLLPLRAHVPANLLAAGTAIAAVHELGASWEELGLVPSRFGRGASHALVAAVPIVLGTAALSVAPGTRERFDDRRIRDAPSPVFEIALRIPIGTALCEELIFRSALLALFERHGSRARALVLSSVLFGLWHVLPTLDARDTDPDMDTDTDTDAAPPPRRDEPLIATVIGNVVATAAAGAALTFLRRRSGTVLAPVLVHASINASAFVAARVNAPRVSRPTPDKSHWTSSPHAG